MGKRERVGGRIRGAVRCGTGRSRLKGPGFWRATGRKEAMEGCKKGGGEAGGKNTERPDKNRC
eukprot:2627763-Pleurochrysis_carterae.AAC.2